MMTYTLFACLGMWLGICGSHVKYDNLTYDQCIKMKSEFSQKTIGDGYITCTPSTAIRIIK